MRFDAFMARLGAGLRDHGLGEECGGEIDVAGGAPEQRVAHAAADEAGFLSRSIEGGKAGAHARTGEEPGGALGIETLGQRRHWKWPGTKRPFS